MTKRTIEQTLTDQLVNQANNTLTNVYAGLVESQPRGKLPEYIFRNYFLPFFANLVPLESKPNIIPEWIAIAGSPTAEVDIIDGANNVLFTVPALYNDSFISLTNRDNVKFSRIAEEYNLRKNHMPVLGERYLNNALDTKLDNMTGVSSISESEAVWMSIFNRYGIVSNASVAATPVAAQNNNLDDMFDLG